MVNKKNIFKVSLLVIGLSLILMGCAEDESPVAPVTSLQLKILAGPTGEVPYNAWVTYMWQAQGGSGNYPSYSYSLTGPGNYSDAGVDVNVTSKKFENLSTPGVYTFELSVKDSKGATASENRSFTVVANSAEPGVDISFGPLEGGKIDHNSIVTYIWKATTEAEFGVITGYTYSLTSNTGYERMSDGQVSATTATFDSLLIGDYKFKVTAYDNSGLSSTDSATFLVREAELMWINDYYLGSQSATFDQRNQWGTAFEGYAWQEFNMWDEYTTSTEVASKLDSLVNGPQSEIQAVVWDLESNADLFMLWYSTNGVGDRDPWLFDYLDNGGTVVLIGEILMDQIYNTTPPAAGDFEVEYMGHDISEVTTIDTTITEKLVWDPVDSVWVLVREVQLDTTTEVPETWAYEDYGAGAGDILGSNGYTNISIDVGKDGNSYQFCDVFPRLVTGTKVLFTETESGEPTGYIYDLPDPKGKLVVLCFNLWYSPAGEIAAVMQKLLAEEVQWTE